MVHASGETPVESILDAVSDGVLVLDERTVILHANPVASRLLESAAEMLVGRPCVLDVPAAGYTKHVLLSGMTLALQVLPITWRGLAASLVLMQPMTEPRDAAQGSKHPPEAWKAPESSKSPDASDLPISGDGLYRILVENLPDGDLFLFDRKLRFLLARGRGMDRHDFDPDAFVGRSLEAAVGPYMARLLEPVYRKALAGHENEIDLDYGEHTYRIRCIPVRNAQGQVELGISMAQDITWLKRIEREVRSLNAQLQELLEREQASRADAENQRALLQDVLDQAPAMMCILQGPTHVYTYVNDIYSKALDRTPSDFLGRTVAQVLPEVAAVGILQILDSVYRTGQPFRASELLVPIDIHQNGMPVDMYFSLTYQPNRDAGGQINGIVVHAINVTDQVLARRIVEQKSAEVARLNQTLEQRVRELALANQELEAFAYSVSHDLRSPLRSINGFGQALLEDYGDRLDDEGRSYLKRLGAAAEQMGELIDDLLSLAQVARRELKRALVNVSELAEQCILRLREQTPTRAVTVHIAPNLSAWADAGLLRIALDNLLDNAWKFTSKTSEAIIEVGEVGEVGEADAGAQAFFVRDNGAGFDPVYIGKLFGTFNRLHSPVDFPGVGIGLATVKRVIDRHGGRIWAEGALQQGATFYFTLPGAGPAS